jgi:CRISPR/Cas system-associated exonuclease Cas4 (RecB family)
MQNLSKTDFKEYLICPKWLWLKKKRHDLFTQPEKSLYAQKLINDGYEIEEFAQKLFADAIEVKGAKDSLSENTQTFLEAKQTMFQATFETDRGLFAKIDILEFDQDSGKWNLYEVKASSGIKTDLEHNHIKDITFQVVAAEESGVEVRKSYIIHLNKEYIRDGEINPRDMLTIADVSDEVAECKEEVELEIDYALKLLEKDELSVNGCDCIYRSHGQRCEAFSVLNPDVPGYSVHHVVGGKKLAALIEDDIFDINDIPDDFKLTDKQQQVVQLQKSGLPQIDYQTITDTLSDLEFPLYFLDYETFGKPWPLLDGYRPNQQVVFQYSLHVVEENGELRHHEYLGSDYESCTKELVDSMQENIGPDGNVIVWYEPFEKGRNDELTNIHPEHTDFLQDINLRIFDLMTIFKKDYLHPDFQGSASIKKVLPVLLPELSYKNLAVQNGTMAMVGWEQSLDENISEEKRNQLRKDLLDYCELDTLAMVEIWRHLKTTI